MLPCYLGQESEGRAGGNPLNKKQSRPRYGRIGGWQVLRDVLIASMNKGQFPIAVVAVVVIVIVLKMDSKDVALLVSRVIDAQERKWFLGYILSVLILLAWGFHAKWQRKGIVEEMNRLSALRSELQTQLANRKLGSSEDK
jgi:hypothetical protein